MFKIGDFSKLTMISIRMLRHYDTMGLLIPTQIDNFTGYRYYSAEQLYIANRIQLLKNMGFSLLLIKEILEIYEDTERFKSYLLLRYTQIQNETLNLQKQLFTLETILNRLGKDELNMDFSITIKEIPELNVASYRNTISSYEKEGELWQLLHSDCAKQNVKYSNSVYNMAVFFDEGYKEMNVDVEVRLCVAGNYPDTDIVKFKTVNSTTVASTILKGDFSQMVNACSAIGNWITDNQYELNGPLFNIYHVSPGADKNPNNWITEICFPVKKK